jgi:hypothetical protein
MSDTLKRDALDYHRYHTPGNVNMSALASVDCASESSSRTATSVLSQIRAGTDELA